MVSRAIRMEGTSLLDRRVLRCLLRHIVESTAELCRVFDNCGKPNRVATVVLGAFLLAVPRSGQAMLVPRDTGSHGATQHHAYVLSELTQNKNPWTVQEFPLTPGGRMRVLGGPLTGFCNSGNLQTHPLLSLAISPLGSLYVSGFFGPTCEAGIEAFAPGASGNVRPMLQIHGEDTRIRLPISMAFDRFGRLYVSQGQLNYPRGRPGQVDVFPANAHGNVAPIGVLIGPKTQIEDKQAIYVAVDARNDILVAQPVLSGTQMLKF